jgi:hypothetical protein
VADDPDDDDYDAREMIWTVRLSRKSSIKLSLKANGLCAAPDVQEWPRARKRSASARGDDSDDSDEIRVQAPAVRRPVALYLASNRSITMRTGTLCSTEEGKVNQPVRPAE